MHLFIIPTIVIFLLFLFVYKKNKASILAGFLFDSFLVALLLTYALFAATQNNWILELSLVFIALAGLFVLLFGIYVLIAFFLLNARLVFKRERRTLSNSLTLIAGLVLISFLIVTTILQDTNPPVWVRAIWMGLSAVALFYMFHILVFLTTLILCNCARPKKNQDYIIVLGSGLINGEVPPLLGGRIDKALRFAQKQRDKTGKAPKLVMSGGQGSDEPRAEAVAMREYAIAKGYNPDYILVEDQSKNTRENMQFSKNVIEQDYGGPGYSSIYATSNYHLLRAGIYARKAKMNISGIGAKTAWYYVPNATLREYVGFLAMHKRRFVFTAILLFLLGAFLEGLPYLLMRFLQNYAVPG